MRSLGCWRQARWLAESDFADPAQPVIVEINVIGIDNTLLQQLAPGHHQKIQPFLVNGSLRVRRICPPPGTTAAKTLTKVRNPNVPDDAEDLAWPDNPGGIWASISAIFPEPIRIGAMEDSAEDAAKVKNTTTLGKLIAELTEELVAQVSGEYASAVADVAERLSAEGTKRPDGLVLVDKDAGDEAVDVLPVARGGIRTGPPG